MTLRKALLFIAMLLVVAGIVVRLSVTRASTVPQTTNKPAFAMCFSQDGTPGVLELFTLNGHHEMKCLNRVGGYGIVRASNNPPTKQHPWSAPTQASIRAETGH